MKGELIKKYLSQQNFRLKYNGFQTTCEIKKRMQGDSSTYFRYLTKIIKVNYSYGKLKWESNGCIITTPVIYNDSTILFNVFNYNAFQAGGYLKDIDHKRLLKGINKNFLDSMNKIYKSRKKFNLAQIENTKNYSRDEEGNIWVIGGRNKFSMPYVLNFNDPYWGGCSSAKLHVNAVEITYFLIRPENQPYYNDSSATSTLLTGATSSSSTTNAIENHKIEVHAGHLGSLDDIYPPNEYGGGNIHAYWGAVGKKCTASDLSLSSVSIIFLDCCGITFSFGDNNANGFYTAKADKIYFENGGPY